MGGLQFPPLTYAEWSWEGRSRFDSDGNRFFGVKWDKFRSGADYLELSGWAKEEYVRRIVASVNATAGIPVEVLEAGCIAELVEAGRALLQFEGHMVWCGHGRDDTRPCVCGYLDAQDRLRATLAKVKGDAA